MSNGPIDIVVPWVNPGDNEWKKSFEYWKKRETGIRPDCRYRDFGIFNYCIQSALENCPWANSIIVVLASPSQKPQWLDEMVAANPKLRIVYHSEYIPKQFLPTFNSNVIEMFYMMIPNLSSNFLVINDDMFFTSPTEETDFFVDDKPVDNREYIRDERWRGYGYFDCNMRNNRHFIRKFLHCNQFIKDPHLAIAHRKDVWLDVWKTFLPYFIKAMKASKFRHQNNVTHWLFRWIYLLSGNYVQRSINEYEKYIILRDGQNFNEIKNAMYSTKVLCINDQECLTYDFNRVKKHLQTILAERFSTNEKV